MDFRDIVHYPFHFHFRAGASSILHHPLDLQWIEKSGLRRSKQRNYKTFKEIFYETFFIPRLVNIKNTGALRKSHSTHFMRILKPPAEEGIYEIVAWARWDTYKNKGWTQRPPAEYGTGLPNSEEGKLVFEQCQDRPPQEHDLDFIVSEDGSGQLKINEFVTVRI